MKNKLDPTTNKFVFVREDAKTSTGKKRYARELYNLHLERRIIREALATNKEILTHVYN